MVRSTTTRRSTETRDARVRRGVGLNHIDVGVIYRGRNRLRERHTRGLAGTRLRGPREMMERGRSDCEGVRSAAVAAGGDAAIRDCQLAGLSLVVLHRVALSLHDALPISVDRVTAERAA